MPFQILTVSLASPCQITTCLPASPCHLAALVKFSHQLPALVKFPHDCLLACVICQRLSNRHSATCQPLPTCHMVACQPMSFTSSCQILIKLLARPCGPYNKAFGFFMKPRRRLNRVICCDFQVSNQFSREESFRFLSGKSKIDSFKSLAGPFQNS